MKKLMIAAFTIAFAAVVQAATVNWAASGLTDSTGGITNISSANIYGFDASVMTQQALLTAFIAGDANALSSGYVVAGYGDYEDGEVYSTIEGYANSQEVNAYFAILDGDKLFISDLDGNGVSIGDSGQPADVEFAIGNSMSNVMAAGTDTFAGAGWYSAAAVPEPTSALMLLVGLAGLALKRKVA